MLWKPINFQGVIVIDDVLVEALGRYLDGKRNRCAAGILKVLNVKVEGACQGSDPFGCVTTEIEKALTSGWGKRGVSQKNRANLAATFWTYVDVLESVTLEFLQQTEHVRHDRLTLEILSGIDRVKGLIEERLQEALTLVCDLEALLDTLPRRIDQRGGASRLWGWIRSWFVRTSALDPRLVASLHKAVEWLSVRDQDLKIRHRDYNSLQLKVQPFLHKLDHYAVLQSLDTYSQDEYRTLYRVLKIAQANTESPAINDDEMRAIVRSVAAPPQVIDLLTAYYKELTEALFSVSRNIKFPADVPDQTRQAARETESVKLQGYSEELKSLGSTINRNRDFLLRTDSNPYTRIRWGFSDWVSGPKPKEIHGLMQVGYDVQSLVGLLQQLQRALSVETIIDRETEEAVGHNAISALMEMAQPLVGRELLKVHGEEFLGYLEALHELSSSSISVIPFVGKALAKALRADWKYHVLHEFPKFHELYKVHIGLVGEASDYGHRHRLAKFLALESSGREWVKEVDPTTHLKSLHSALMEIKKDLTTFEEELKGLLPSEVPLKQTQLLQYRYHYGCFCSSFWMRDPAGMNVRSQYFFIEQHFENLEFCLQEAAGRHFQSV